MLSFHLKDLLRPLQLPPWGKHTPASCDIEKTSAPITVCIRLHVVNILTHVRQQFHHSQNNQQLHDVDDMGCVWFSSTSLLPALQLN